jgi:sulfoxide reductase heme-binding subunit YedZ
VAANPPARRSARLPGLKPVTWALCLLPLAWLLGAGFRDDLTADPLKYITHFTGKTTLAILTATLAVTPLRQLTGLNALARVRRLIGLFAFGYATLHLLIYFIFDRGMVLAELGEDIAKRPYITVGFAAWLILLALAATSPRAMVRRLGSERWQTLHRLVYGVAVLAPLHFAWAQKKDLTPMLPFVLALTVVAVLRLAARIRRPMPRRSDRRLSDPPTI